MVYSVYDEFFVFFFMRALRMRGNFGLRAGDFMPLRGGDVPRSGAEKGYFGRPAEQLLPLRGRVVPRSGAGYFALSGKVTKTLSKGSPPLEIPLKSRFVVILFSALAYRKGEASCPAAAPAVEWSNFCLLIGVPCTAVFWQTLRQNQAPRSKAADL